MRGALIVTLLRTVLLTCSVAGAAIATEREPAAVVDLGTESGAALVQATWRYSDARIVDTSFRAPDAQGQPTGAPLVLSATSHNPWPSSAYRVRCRAIQAADSSRESGFG